VDAAPGVPDVAAAIRNERWVIDGNYSVVRDLVWPRCTAFVWLDYSFARVFSRALRRTAARVITGRRLYGGNRETFRQALFDRDGIPWWVIRTYARRRREFPLLFGLPDYRGTTLIQFRTPAAAEAFLVEESERRASRSRFASVGLVFGTAPPPRGGSRSFTPAATGGRDSGCPAVNPTLVSRLRRQSLERCAKSWAALFG